MPADGGAIMFEVYRTGGDRGCYRVVYFTELGADERDAAIEAALAGEPFFDGFLAGARLEAAKGVLAAFTRGLNEGRAGTRGDLERRLTPFLAR
jgi:hypothetical protein